MKTTRLGVRLSSLLVCLLLPGQNVVVFVSPFVLNKGATGLCAAAGANPNGLTKQTKNCPLGTTTTTTALNSSPRRLQSQQDANTFKASYTRAVAYNRKRHLERTMPSQATTNGLLYQLQVLSSILTFVLGMQVGVASIVLLLPSLLVKSRQQQQQQEPMMDNISSASGGSRTAIVALWARSQMAQMSSGPDVLAPKLMNRLSLFGGGGGGPPGSTQLTAICRWLARTNYRLTRGIFEDQIAYVLTLFNTGLITPMHIRTCWLDDCIQTFVQSLDGENEGVSTTASPPRGNVVILGSGFDTRCYRLNLQEQDLQLFEVDAPGTQDEKRRVLKEASIDASHVTFCPCDFQAQDWLECLLQAGLDASLPTMIIWEGVTMYLPRPVVQDTLQKISIIAKNSQSSSSKWYIAFDYINSTWAMSPLWRRAMKRVGEPFRFAMNPHSREVDDLIQSCDLELLEHLKDEQELMERYVPKHYKDRSTGIVGDYGGFVVAGVKS